MVDEKKELALEEYKKTVDIAIYEGTMYWQRFNVLFAVNAAILVFLGVIVGNQTMISQNQDAQRVLVFGACFIGFVSSISTTFICLRSQMFYRSWWQHIRRLEKEVLKEFSLMKDLNAYFRTQSLVRQMSVVTVSLVTPVTFSGLFGILPVLLYGHIAIPYLFLLSLVMAFLVFGCIYSDWRRSKEYEK